MTSNIEPRLCRFRSTVIHIHVHMDIYISGLDPYSTPQVGFLPVFCTYYCILPAFCTCYCICTDTVGLYYTHSSTPITSACWLLEVPYWYSTVLYLAVLARDEEHASHPNSSGPPGVFYTCFYNITTHHALRLRLEKTLCIWLDRASFRFLMHTP